MPVTQLARARQHMQIDATRANEHFPQFDSMSAPNTRGTAGNRNPPQAVVITTDMAASERTPKSEGCILLRPGSYLKKTVFVVPFETSQARPELMPCRFDSRLLWRIARCRKDDNLTRRRRLQFFRARCHRRAPLTARPRAWWETPACLDWFSCWNIHQNKTKKTKKLLERMWGSVVSRTHVRAQTAWMLLCLMSLLCVWLFIFQLIYVALEEQVFSNHIKQQTKGRDVEFM